MELGSGTFTAGVSYTSPVAYNDFVAEGTFLAQLLSLAVGARFTLQESFNYDPAVHAAPADAKWANTVVLDDLLTAGYITAVDDGAFSGPFDHQPAGYLRVKVEVDVAGSVEGNFHFIPSTNLREQRRATA